MRFSKLIALAKFIKLMLLKIDYYKLCTNFLVSIFERNFFFWKVVSFPGQYWFCYNFKCVGLTIVNAKKY